MAKHVMKTIKKPKEGTATVFKTDERGKIPVMKGKGRDSYRCGTCKNIILKNVNRNQFINIVFICPNCGSYNIC